MLSRVISQYLDQAGRMAQHRANSQDREAAGHRVVAAILHSGNRVLLCHGRQTDVGIPTSGISRVDMSRLGSGRTRRFVVS